MVAKLSNTFIRVWRACSKVNKKVAAIIIAGAVFAVVALGATMLVYSYTQVSVSLDHVGFHSIDWDLTVSSLIMLGANALMGDYLGSALSLIDGVNLDLVFGLSNGGLLPVYIPSVTYDLAVNGVPVGQSTSTVSATINPGQTKQITAVQNVKKSSLAPAVSSIVEAGGIVDVKVRGTAYFELLGLEIPVPFELSKRISIIDEIEKKLNQSALGTMITLDDPGSEARQGAMVPISGRLATDDGRALDGMVVYIKDEDTGSGDDDIAILRTDAHGEFYYQWTARAMDPFDSIVEIYAVFEGGSGFERARSVQHNIAIVDDHPVAETQTQQRDAFSSTSINLIISDTTIREGDILEISGWLVDTHGNGLQNAIVYIKDEDAGSGDDDIAILRTDAHGEFYYQWTARAMDPFDSIVEIYAVFEGSPDFGSSRSTQIDVRVR